jgi:putative ABC transport system ATP-binding protein
VRQLLGDSGHGGKIIQLSNLDIGQMPDAPGNPVSYTGNLDSAYHDGGAVACLTAFRYARAMEAIMSSLAVVNPGFVERSAAAQEAAVNDTIIAATDVHKVYDSVEVEVHALKGVNLSIRRGEMVAIMGPSGCGKTTLLNTFSGLDDLTQGQVIIDGTPIHELSDKKRTRFRATKMGFVFQFFNLLPVLSAVENVELPLLVAGVKPSAARRRSLDALDRVGLADQAHKRPGAMSGGQQQRVTIARALVNDPAIVWADEPTGNLDSETAAEVMDLLCSMNEEQTQTFVLVTHDPTIAARADRIVRMRDGFIASDKRNGRQGDARQP